MKNPLPILSAKDISWKADNKTILNNISLNLYPGELLGVIGPNGAGKSSLLKVLANVVQADSGDLHINNLSYRDTSTKSFSAAIAYLEQNPKSHWPLFVHKIIELGRISNQGYSRKLAAPDKIAIAQAIEATGVANLLNRVITTLSEGEKILVHLARLLASKPQLIIADEPVASLDPYHQLLVMEIFRSLIQEQESFSAILVLHDLNLAAQFCDSLILLNNGSVVSSGKPADVITHENLKQFYRINADINHDNENPVLSKSRVFSEGA